MTSETSAKSTAEISITADTPLASTPVSAIQAYSADLYRWCESPDPTVEDSCAATVFAAADGSPTLRINGRLAHSGRDPVRESRRLVDNAGGNGPVVILGFGLGYMAEAASADDRKRSIIVVERSSALLRLAFRHRDLSRLLERPNLRFVVGDANGLREALESESGEPTLFVNQAACAPFAAWYETAKTLFQAKQNRDAVNTATRRRFGRRWVRNISRNLKMIADLPGVAHLTRGLHGLPALVVAAGPSLDRHLAELSVFAKCCVVITVDTALRAVLNAGVTPDFILVVDPQYWNSRHLDHCDVEGACLISEAAVYPSVFRLPFARRFLCESPYPLARYLEARVDSKGSLGAGGSVATTAWDFARLLGCDPVFVIGLDLAFPDMKTHFKGAVFEESAYRTARRLEPAETRDFQALNDGFPFIARTADGRSILSDKRLSLYAAWFEARVRRPRMPATYRLSPGLNIDGMGIATAEDILTTGDRRNEIDKRLRTLYREAENRSAENAAVRDANLRRATSTLRSELAALEIAARASAASTDSADSTAALAEMIERSPVKTIAEFLTFTGKGTGDVHRRQRWRELAESAAYQRQILPEML